ncbi:MAG TPA: nitrite reductase large subunit NirB [Paenibacillus sp.]|uniref:nitrite reductase large subunit NirB n=1 Tax=Paenibacillus sp. TaxID=58172 RepID=UPI002CEF2555|nr:nitrite reductase large subunit NirB [Paenibacillus sp.]HUC91202.1 nitrite reductase large subunit NirB [Paenibacillus sp.]
MRKKLVLIGNGMAGVNGIEQLLRLAPDRYDITIFGSEPHPNYNRILLSSVLAGNANMDDIVLHSWEWYAAHGITLHAGHTVTAIDTKRKYVETDSGLRADYDELVIATGSRPFMLPLPGADKEGVIAFRDMKDCKTMIETARTHRKAVVIGGGLLGLEAARGLLNLNMEVTVVHIHKHLMDRQLDAPAALMLQRELRQQGMKFLLEKNTEKITGKKRVAGVRFTDGTEMAADLVVMAVGIKPNIELAAKSGVDVNRGILVNDYLETNKPGVYAVGECAEHRGIAYGLVAPLYEQGAVLAKRLAGVKTDGYHGSVVSTKLKVSGVEVFSAGEFLDADDTRAVRMQDEFGGVYKKAVIRDGRLVGAVLFGDTTDGTRLFSMIRSGENVAGREKEILLGSGAPAAASGADKAAALGENEIVCACNGVTKGTIMRAIHEESLQTVEDIKTCTKASGSCGSCKTTVGFILEYAQRHGGTGEPAVKETICACTALDHEEVIQAIRTGRFRHASEARAALGWKSEEGCAACEPALHYYVGVHGHGSPAEGQATAPLRQAFSAAAQPGGPDGDGGACSLVPRMPGGVTNAPQLRRIADVVEKYGIPLVKLMNGAELELFGISASAISSVREELGMPAEAPLTGAAVRSIATCGGLRYEQDAMQDSIAVGIALDARLAQLPMPQETTVGVSASPRHRAGSLTKDIGIAGTPGGWELYAGGGGERKPQAGQLVCTAETDEQLLAYTLAFVQHYRETARYAERVSQWIERLGLVRIRETIFNPLAASLLAERLEKAAAARVGKQADQQPEAAGTR